MILNPSSRLTILEDSLLISSLSPFRCNKDNQMNCKIGDLSGKSGQKLKIIADLSGTETSRVFYTDILLPLQGTHSVIGRSIVIQDDQAPKQRGNRLACATIFR